MSAVEIAQVFDISLTVFDQNIETHLPVLGVDDLGSIMRWHRDRIKAFVQEMGPSEIKIALFSYIFLQYVEIWTKRKKANQANVWEGE